MLAWVFERCGGQAKAEETPIGLMPPIGEGGIPTEGLDLTEEQMRELLKVDPELWREQLPQIQGHFAKFGDRLPGELKAQLESLEQRLGG